MNIWEKIKKWMSLIGFVFFWLLILGAFCFVLFLLVLAFDNLKELKEAGGEKLIEWAFKIAGGIIAVIGLAAVIRRLRIAEQQVETSQKQVKNMINQVESMAAQAKSMEMQAKISQKGQYSERFVKSVEQTASDKLEICLGGLASLDALSRENKEEYRRVWEYLCEFLRHHEPLKDKGEKTHPKVNAIAKMLRERKREYENFKLDLTEAHLERANLYEVHLEYANLVGANLERADLEGANLKSTNLVRANLVGAKLERADLEYAYLYKAHLEEANLENADLEGVDLWGASLERADLEGASLVRASLWNANLVRANLERADLSEANLGGAKLERVLFGGKMESGDPQDLTALKPEQLRGTYYTDPMPKLPEGISEADKPKAISYTEWLEKYR